MFGHVARQAAGKPLLYYHAASNARRACFKIGLLFIPFLWDDIRKKDRITNVLSIKAGSRVLRKGAFLDWGLKN